MRLLYVTLRNLLHHEVRLNLHLLAEHTSLGAPFARDGQHADWRLRVDEGVDAAGHVGKRELVCCLDMLVRCGSVGRGCRRTWPIGLRSVME
jgi:hypothetical protein